MTDAEFLDALEIRFRLPGEKELSGPDATRLEVLAYGDGQGGWQFGMSKRYVLDYIEMARERLVRLARERLTS